MPLLVGAQSASVPESSLAFEVASVKLNKSNDARAGVGQGPGGRVTATNVTLRVLIRSAYGLQPFQIAGDTESLDARRYDVVAKARESDLEKNGFLGKGKSD